MSRAESQTVEIGIRKERIVQGCFKTRVDLSRSALTFGQTQPPNYNLLTLERTCMNQGRGKKTCNENVKEGNVYKIDVLRVYKWRNTMGWCL